jgi:hypothetical protein
MVFLFIIDLYKRGVKNIFCCRKMQPAIDQLQKNRGPALRMVKIDAAVQNNPVKESNSEGNTAFVFYKNGRGL